MNDDHLPRHLSHRSPEPEVSRFLHAFLHHAPVAALVLDDEGRVLEANARAEALLNVPEGQLPGRAFTSLLAPEHEREFRRAIRIARERGEASPELEAGLASRGAEGTLVSVTFLPIRNERMRIILILRDLTLESHKREVAVSVRTRAYQAEHERDQKLAALGKLIAGVVHELKTPLTYSRNLIELQHRLLSEMAVRHPDAASDLQNALEHNAEMLHGNDRAAAILHQLRPLAQNRHRERQSVDLVELAVSAAREFRGTNETKVHLALDLQGSHAVLVEKDEILAAVLNLLRNAAQAMGGEGTIVLQTRNGDVPPQIRIVDHGPGIPEGVLPHLFEPFHTTKESGTGLGLFIAKQAVEAHGGTLTHAPTPGGGATFVIQLQAT